MGIAVKSGAERPAYLDMPSIEQELRQPDDRERKRNLPAVAEPTHQHIRYMMRIRRTTTEGR